eukprot:TRINITY_DN55531_c0_g1_i1.p1 TRINITY_DN55531_c0_g1~~TRINITY_DN55531_c0_g1_i1.p1  ORF type:complete len:306 (+),score=35.22 TRINITY_DN55531_c0_g1_i1:33-950(+)
MARSCEQIQHDYTSVAGVVPEDVRPQLQRLGAEHVQLRKQCNLLQEQEREFQQAMEEADTEVQSLQNRLILVTQALQQCATGAPPGLAPTPSQHTVGAPAAQLQNPDPNFEIYLEKVKAKFFNTPSPTQSAPPPYADEPPPPPPPLPAVASQAYQQSGGHRHSPSPTRDGFTRQYSPLAPLHPRYTTPPQRRREAYEVAPNLRMSLAEYQQHTSDINRATFLDTAASWLSEADLPPPPVAPWRDEGSRPGSRAVSPVRTASRSSSPALQRATSPVPAERSSPRLGLTRVRYSPSPGPRVASPRAW